MEFDHNLMFSFVSVLSTVLFILVACVTVFRGIRARWPVKVNCWFCNSTVKVWRWQQEWWLCPSCEQYNGFSKDGDYSYDIPEQCERSLNGSRRYCTSPSKKSKVSQSHLCKACNKKERIKLSELSRFEPVNERNYDSEVTKFKQRLEEKYPLCSNCKGVVRNVLHKQALWLTHYKMLLFKQKPIHMIVNNARKSENIFRVVSTILDSVLMYNSEYLMLPIGGLFFQLCACWASPARRRTTDILLAFLWICIIMLIPFKELKLLKTNIVNDWFSLEYVTQYHMVMLFASIIGFINIKPKSDKISRKSMSFKKMEIRSNGTIRSESPLSDINDNSYFDTKTITEMQETINTSHSSSNLTNNLTPPIYRESPVPSKSAIFSQNSTILQDPYASPTPSNTSNYSNSFSFRSHLPDSYSLNDSLSTLSMLSLGEDSPRSTARKSKIFETKVYNTKSPDLFRRSSFLHSKRHILSPPKLKSVMQTSWVAGGYWQEGMDAPSLSRSSSQSSGFGSAGSNLAPSREPSVHELDRCSVTSDATQSCYTGRQTSVSPTGSFYYQPQQQHQQVTSFSFARPKSPVCNLTSNKFIPDHVFPQHIPQNYPVNAMFTDASLHSPGIHMNGLKDRLEMPVFPGQTTTVVANSTWLPALLCGSLIVNIIVLCTTLLR